jgi:hypothetical protein
MPVERLAPVNDFVLFDARLERLLANQVVIDRRHAPDHRLCRAALDDALIELLIAEALAPCPYHVAGRHHRAAEHDRKDQRFLCLLRFPLPCWKSRQGLEASRLKVSAVANLIDAEARRFLPRWKFLERLNEFALLIAGRDALRCVSFSSNTDCCRTPIGTHCRLTALPSCRPYSLLHEPRD